MTPWRRTLYPAQHVLRKTGRVRPESKDGEPRTPDALSRINRGSPDWFVESSTPVQWWNGEGGEAGSSRQSSRFSNKPRGVAHAQAGIRPLPPADGKPPSTDIAELFKRANDRVVSRASTSNLPTPSFGQRIYEAVDEDSKLADRYNAAIVTLRDRLDQKGINAVSAHFRRMDSDGSGSLDLDEFVRAVSALDNRVDRRVGEMLMHAVDGDGGGTVNYKEFVDALRFGRVKFMTRHVKDDERLRASLDPTAPIGSTQFYEPQHTKKMPVRANVLERIDQQYKIRSGIGRDPFGRRHPIRPPPTETKVHYEEPKLYWPLSPDKDKSPSAAEVKQSVLSKSPPRPQPTNNHIPYGIMSDASENLAAFDARAQKRYLSIGDAFKLADSDGDGVAEWPEFRDAMLDLAPPGGLSEDTIRKTFKEADRSRQGRLTLDDFTAAFGIGGRFIPNCLKPQRDRVSKDHEVWSWDAQPKHQKEYDRTPGFGRSRSSLN